MKSPIDYFSLETTANLIRHGSNPQATPAQRAEINAVLERRNHYHHSICTEHVNIDLSDITLTAQDLDMPHAQYLDGIEICGNFLGLPVLRTITGGV